MDKLHSMQYRKELLQKIKITPKERAWLLTNPVYSSKFGCEYLKADILQLKPNTKYLIRINCHRFDPYYPIMPALAIPIPKHGHLKVDEQYHKDALIKPNSPIKKLSLPMSEAHPSQVYFQSSSGLLEITYWCCMRKFNRWLQSTMLDSAAMKKMVTAENQFMYDCAYIEGLDKDASIDNLLFNKFVFSIEAIEV